MENERKCAHELCTCIHVGESDYCSDHCKDVTDQDITEIKCGCGHPGC